MSYRSVGKRVLVVIGVIVVIVIVSDLLGWRYLRVPVQAGMSKLLGQPVTIKKPFRLHLRSTLDVRAGGMKVGAPAGSDTDDLLNLDGLRIQTHWSTLLGSGLSFRLVELAGGKISVHRGADGRTNWPGGSEEKDASTDDPLDLPVINKLVLGKTDVRIRDDASELSMQVALHSEDGENDATTLFAEANGQWQGRNLAFDIEAPEALATIGNGSTELVKVAAKIGELKLYFTGAIGQLQSGNDVKGDVRLEGPSLGALAVVPGLTLPATPPFLVSGKLTRQHATVSLNLDRAEIGDSRMKAALTYDGKPKTPTLEGKITASRLVLRDLMPTIGAQASKEPSTNSARDDEQSEEVRKILPNEPLSIPSLQAMNADMGFSLSRLDLGTNALSPIRSLAAHLTLIDGKLALSEIEASVAGGQLGGEMQLVTTNESVAPQFNADLSLSGVDLREWIKADTADLFVAGQFSGHLNIAGQGQTTAEILGSLDGGVKGELRNGSISHLAVELGGIDIAQAIGVAVTENAPLPLTCAMLDLQVDNGNVRSKLFLLDTEDTLLFLTGAANLQQETLDLKLVSTPKDWTRACLRAPIEIGGTFARPEFGIDEAPIVVKALASIALAAVTPAAAILALVDTGEESKGSDCQAAVTLLKEQVAEHGE